MPVPRATRLTHHAVIGSTPPDLLEALLASVADAVYMVDHAGLVRFANPAALGILGYAESELLGRPSHATIHNRRPDGRPCLEAECPLLRPRTSGEPVRVEEDWFVRHDGTMVAVAYSSAPLATSGGRGAVVVFRDVTERREAELTKQREAAERARAEELQASRARILAAADAERRRLGRDIHDGAQQRLMNVALAVRHGLTDLQDDPASVAGTLTGALAELRATIGDLRDLAAGIHPAILTNRGLNAAVESLTSRMPVATHFSVPAERYPPRTEATAYFVIAEALANITKHAHASGAWVDVSESGGRVVLTVRDNGRGGAELTAGRGLQGLSDRVHAANGTLRVDSVRGAGTAVVVELPLDS
jgi:PAS domain S-box-containing protein